MTEPRDSVSLPGGWVLLSPAGARVCAGALNLLEHYGRRDGGQRSPDFVATQRTLAAALSDVDLSTSVTHVVADATFPRLLDPVGTATAALMLGITRHGVADLCRRGVLTTAVRQGRSWLVERDEVASLAAERRREEVA